MKELFKSGYLCNPQQAYTLRRTVIDEGLAPGDRVIVAGQYKVQPGSVVASAVASADVAKEQ